MRDAAALADGAAVDLNAGRPKGGLGDFVRRRDSESAAGHNIGERDPDDGNVKNAMGSGNFDQALDAGDSPVGP